MDYNTGWFAAAAIINHPHNRKSARWTKNHIIYTGGSPICGSNIGKDMVFRKMTSGICLKWVECARCLKLAKKLEDYFVDENGKKCKEFIIMSPGNEAILLSCVMEHFKQDLIENSFRWKNLDLIHEELSHQIDNINRVRESILLRIENERKN